MARLAILEHPDPRLRQSSARVLTFDSTFQRRVDDLLETLHASGGIGLSAPQTGVLQRLAVADLSGDASDPQVYVNPEILARSATGFVEESCLSVPGVVASVMRATRVRVRAQDRHGEPFERDLEGMHAVCLQHEIDHLDGILFIDRLFFWQRFMLGRQARRRATHGPAATAR
jgi:peptide deformylase